MKMGVGIFIKRGEQILIGRRAKEDLFALPGGWIESKEFVYEAAIREVKEETGLDITFGPYITTIDHSYILAVTEGKWFDADQITFWVLAQYLEGEAVVKEPEKCLYWKWKYPTDVMSDIIPQYLWTPKDLWRRILKPYFRI
jgi:8-oxo-dGTP diphosphatase